MYWSMVYELGNENIISYRSEGMNKIMITLGKMFIILHIFQNLISFNFLVITIQGVVGNFSLKSL